MAAGAASRHHRRSSPANPSNQSPGTTRQAAEPTRCADGRMSGLARRRIRASSSRRPVRRTGQANSAGRPATQWSARRAPARAEVPTWLHRSCALPPLYSYRHWAAQRMAVNGRCQGSGLGPRSYLGDGTERADLDMDIREAAHRSRFEALRDGVLRWVETGDCPLPLPIRDIGSGRPTCQFGACPDYCGVGLDAQCRHGPCKKFHHRRGRSSQQGRHRIPWQSRRMNGKPRVRSRTVQADCATIITSGGSRS